MQPRLADQRLQLCLRNLRDLHDHIRGLAPHECYEHVRRGLEQELLALLGQMQEQPVGPQHREDALGGAKSGTAPVIDFAHAVQRQRALADVG